MPGRLLQIISILFLFIQIKVQSQDQYLPVITRQLPSNYFDKVTHMTSQLEREISFSIDKILWQLEKREERLRLKLEKVDSLKARELFDNNLVTYEQLEKVLEKGLSVDLYIPFIDSLGTALNYLQQNPYLLRTLLASKEKLEEAFRKLKSLEITIRKAEEIKSFITERKNYLTEVLGRFGFSNQLKKLSKHAYYYNEQLKEYKATLKSPGKTVRQLIEWLSQSGSFRDFLRTNSMLAFLFPKQDNPQELVRQPNSDGLQTRNEINTLIERTGSCGIGVQNQFRQNIQDAFNTISRLKNELIERGVYSSNDILPEDFKPNSQKTKSLLKRIEVGGNLQTQKATNFFPVTTDLGLSFGYKLNDKSVLGIGASYKLGWGNDWNHLKLTSEGAGIRSFLDLRLKKNWCISGGLEMNYKNALKENESLKNYSAWQRSGLLGINKLINSQSHLFKKTKLQVLWDFLSYRQIPRTAPVLVRVIHCLH